jgi:hypothetical protein
LDEINQFLVGRIDQSHVYIYTFGMPQKDQNAMEGYYEEEGLIIRSNSSYEKFIRLVQQYEEQDFRRAQAKA